MRRSLSAVAAALLAFLLVGCDRALPKYEFSLTRINADGRAYEGEGNYAQHPWSCVHDNKTGLTWEVKTEASGLHGAANTVTWFNKDEMANLGYEGKANGGVCSGSACNTAAFIDAVNAEHLCGYSDWRMPTKDEASTIIDVTIRFPGPTVPQAFFPNTRGDKLGYWTGTAFEKHMSGAWAWRLDHGADFVAPKDEPRFVIAVRGSANTTKDASTSAK
jgi:hypothetical protein